MTDQVLIGLAGFMNNCYAPGMVPRWENADKTAHLFHGVVNEINTFAFEGTTDAAEWVQDFSPTEVQDATIGPVHADSLANVRALVPQMLTCLKTLGNPPFYLIGHSKGAREVIIALAECKLAGVLPLRTVAFEPPKAGGEGLANYLALDDLVWTQTWNSHGSDIVTLVPDGLGWADAGYKLRLQVSDDFSIAQKHRMPGVLTGLGVNIPVPP